MKLSYILNLLVLFLGRAFAAETSVERDLSAEFGSYSGGFVLYDESQQRWLRWDGTRRSIESWNQDQTLRSAFATSCVWYYKALAARIGLERYQQVIPKVGYGNNDLTGGVTQFWLQSSLTISPDEQVEFLRRLHARKLPFAATSVDTVLDIMTLSRAGQTAFRGKTGSAFDTQKNIPILGWFIGSVSTPSGLYLFATRITGGENPSGITARKITESVLFTLNILPKHE